jgi:thymidylate synthase
MNMLVYDVRNINEALDNLMSDTSSPGTRKSYWTLRESRNGPVLEMNCPVATVYERPMERVSFSHARDANPFFHLFEAIWIAAGRDDVAFLALFNARMLEYSDDGRTFHAPYGHRLRRHFQRQTSMEDIGILGSSRPPMVYTIDQIVKCASMLRDDPNTRRAVMSIWDPCRDLGAESKDIPCNDTVFFKAREHRDRDQNLHWHLDMTVCCRSNDALWGAYGTNVVQFSLIQELVASSANMRVGTYTQLSDSFHIYIGNAVWQRMQMAYDWNRDPYVQDTSVAFDWQVTPYPLLWNDDLVGWLHEAEKLCSDILGSTTIEPSEFKHPFFREVAIPLWKTWWLYKNTGLSSAIDFLETRDLSIDWFAAAMAWLIRRARK